ncbi:MAG: FAD/NAD(P)-binding protein [Steroidobacteraceae bacterium]
MSDPARTVVVVGGGVSGALFALKLHRRRPSWRIIIAESRKRLGRGIAYGACDDSQLLNVPVSRMEVGLSPGFGAWLDSHRDELAEALVESRLDLASAFVPRHLFGDYLEERLREVLDNRSLTGVSSLRGEVVRVSSGAGGSPRSVLLTDGRRIPADIVVLAMGHLPPRPPPGPDSWLYDSGYFISDPWAPEAFEDVEPDEPLLLIGSGLTTVDIALRLQQRGHRGALLALSRRGLTPRAHAAGGAWPEFLQPHVGASPRALTRLVRGQIDQASAQGVPWQRVFDAARPAVPAIWNAWSGAMRRQFLRHLRPRWDVHRHRMAPRIDEAFSRLQSSGALEIVPARIAAFRTVGRFVDATLHLRGGGERTFRAGHVVNCTGPGGDVGRIAVPLIADLREQRLALADPLGVGLETRDCAVIDAAGEASNWLFALGPLTRPAWWEIIAVPEITLQIDRLVAQLASPAQAARLTAADFMDMGSGI